MLLKYGGRPRIRRSINTIIYTPHFYWEAPNGQGWGYSPKNPLYPIPWDILWFKGKIVSE